MLGISLLGCLNFLRSWPKSLARILARRVLPAFAHRFDAVALALSAAAVSGPVRVRLVVPVRPPRHGEALVAVARVQRGAEARYLKEGRKEGRSIKRDRRLGRRSRRRVGAGKCRAGGVNLAVTIASGGWLKILQGCKAVEIWSLVIAESIFV